MTVGLGYTCLKSLKEQGIRKGRVELSSTTRSFSPQVEFLLPHGSLSSALKVF